MKLEEEFSQFVAIHKLAILKAKIIDYYRTLEQTGINIPDFMRDDTPEKKADKDIKNLLLTDINKFNSLYEKAWGELAPLLD
jgi:hypothetical protein